MALVVPAILPSSRKELERWLKFFSHVPSVERVQIDVVDGRLAPSKSWPYNSLDMDKDAGSWKESFILPKIDKIKYEMDMMCMDALDSAGDWLALGATRLIFHIEAVVAIPNFFATVRQKYGGGKDMELSHLLSVGIALNIKTDMRVAEPYLSEVDFVQFMGIEKIGRQGQRFDKRVIDNVKKVRSRHPHIPIQVDGGVNLEHAKELLSAGVGTIVVGSAILDAKDPITAITSFQALESPYGV